MKRYKVITSSAALADAEEVFRYIAEDSLEHAAKWFNRLTDEILALDTNPFRCAAAPDRAPPGAPEIRHLIVGNYRVLFVIEDDRVEILHVRHAARLPMLRERRPPRA